jgi:2-dehydropantoate 2-reductase
VLAGVTYQAATLIEPGLVRHVAEGPTEFGPWVTPPCERDNALTAIADAFSSAGFETRLVSDPRQPIWRKAVINAAINPVSALLELPNGRIPCQPEARWLLESLAHEAAAVAAAEGYPVLDAEAQSVAICRATSCNLSSMLQDRMAGRVSELDALTGRIVHLGKQHGLDISVSETVWNQIKAIEQAWILK